MSPNEARVKPSSLQALGNWLDNQLAKLERIGQRLEDPIEEPTPEELLKLPRRLRRCRRPAALLHPVNGELLDDMHRDYESAKELLTRLHDKWRPMLYPNQQ